MSLEQPKTILLKPDFTHLLNILNFVLALQSASIMLLLQWKNWNAL